MTHKECYTLFYQYNVEDEAKISQLIENANAIAEDALGKYFQEHNVQNVAFSIDWDYDEDVNEEL